MTDVKNEKKIGGWHTRSLIIPAAVVLVIMHALIIVCIILVNNSSNALSITMQKYTQYISDATSLQAGSSLMSETASTYVLRPLMDNGNPNLGPLMAYVSELGVDRRGDDVIEKFKEYDEISPEAFEYLRIAANSANSMVDAQQHALALIGTIYDVSDIPALKAIPEYELTEVELSYDDETKEKVAVNLVFGTMYTNDKQSVSQNVSACVEILQAESNQKAAAAMRRIEIMRTLLWIITISITAVELVIFVVLIRHLVIPITRFVRMILRGSSLDQDVGLYEVRKLAHSYNELLDRRNKLENVLRSTAETDALTNLPNRYALDQYIEKLDGRGYSIAVFAFDLNFLKRTNDTKGHLAGDHLLCSAAECISKCFEIEGDNNCFRQGGDEFAAVIKGHTLKDIERRADEFYKEQPKFGVSIAMGYAFAEDIGEVNLHELFGEADKRMYAAKMKMHDDMLDGDY